MKRRNVFSLFFIALGMWLGWMFVGCRRVTPRQTIAASGTGFQPVAYSPPPRDMDAVVEFARDRVLCELRVEPGSQFALITLLSVIGFALQVLQYCQQHNAIKQHAMLKSRPDGALARRFKQRLMGQYREENPDASAAAVATHVDAAVKAFANATPDEVRSLHDDLQRLNQSPTPIVLFQLSQELSQ